MNRSPLVSICSLVYNHAAFLSDYFEGLLKQETTFDFELLIYDDASSDNSAEIILNYAEKYPEIIKPIIQSENQFSKGVDVNIVYNFSRIKGKYVAICEGDDYWTDPHKLQKQVDFLESHPDYNLCCHNWEIDTNGVISPSPVHYLYKEPLSFDFATLPWVWITKTVTVMFRNHVFDYDLMKRYQYGRDVQLVYHLLTTGKGYFLPVVMCRYRIHDGGVWGGKDQNEKNRTTWMVYKELYSFENNKAVRKRTLNAGLAYFNGILYSKKNVTLFMKNWSFYFYCISLIRDFKDLAFTIGAIFPPKFVKFVMGKIRV